MNSRLRSIPAALVFLAAFGGQPASAQTPVLRGITGINIEYLPPQQSVHMPIYDRLKRRGVLEQYKEFMSPLRLTRLLTVGLQECGFINAIYRAARITYCYELVADMQRQIAESNVLPGFRREDAIVGGFVSTMLHETGHALFDLFDIPLFGREEDAADAIGAYVSLQFGPTTARRILTGTAFVWRASEITRQNRGNRRFEDYSDEHGTDAQRFYNTVCIALGGDAVEGTSTFADFTQLLPEGRRRRCPVEYLQVKKAFARHVLPHVDITLMKKVRATEWLRSEDGSEVLPPPAPGPQGGPGPRPGGLPKPGGPR